MGRGLQRGRRDRAGSRLRCRLAQKQVFEHLGILFDLEAYFPAYLHLIYQRKLI